MSAPPQATPGDDEDPAIVEVGPEAASADLERLLSAAERAALARFTAPKRRADWLLGRAAAKEAVARALAAAGAACPDPTAIEVAADADGAPRVALPPGLPRAVASLTHGHGRAAAWATLPDLGQGHPGVDLERVRPRPEGTLRFYLRPEERARVLALAPGPGGDAWGPRDEAAVVVWALKEAAFKALAPARGHGLLDVEVALEGLLGAAPGASAWGAARGRARVVYVDRMAVRARALGVAAVDAGWRRAGNLVLAWARARP